ncbi:MAG: MFS transporter [Sulfolobaceae archaeon]
MVEYSRSEVIKVAVAGVVGTTIEWYDFFIAGTAAALAWPKVFFPSNDPSSSLLNSIITFGIGFVTRPIGAILFGHIGDRLGRKTTLIWTLLTMGLGTLGIALTPPYAAIGILAGILVVIFRLIQGLGVGGEWGGATALVAEFAAKSKYRAFWGSWVQQGVPFGLIAANGAYYIISSSVSPQAFLDWGWRVPFYIGVVIIIVGIIIRYRIAETPLFKSLIETRRVERVPFASLIKNQGKTVALLAIGWAYHNAMFYIITSFSQGYLTNYLNVPKSLASLSVLLAAVVEVFILIISSIIADYIGRKKVIIISSGLTVIAVWPYFMLLNTADPLIVILSQIMFLSVIGFGYGVLPTFFSEQYPTKYRYTGTAFTYHIAAPFSGGLAPILAQYFITATGGNALLAWPYIAILGSIYGAAAAISVSLTKETLHEGMKE